MEGLVRQTRVHLEVDEGERLRVVKHIQLSSDLNQLSAASGEEAGGEQLDNQGSQIQTKDHRGHQKSIQHLILLKE